MDFIQTANKQIDKFGAGRHGFSPGNPAGGVQATFVSPEFFDDLMMEIVNVILAGGIAPAAATRNQLLLALRAAGVFQTPAQFDNTTKAATTAFSKTRGLEGSGMSLVTVTGSLTAAHAGGTVAINSASATTQTLPAANAFPVNGRIELFNINTGVGTVQRAGADTIQVNNATVTSLALKAGDTLTLASDGVSKWYAVGGSAQLGSAAVFAQSASTNGYKQFPGGWIIQQGTVSGISGGSSASVTLPITYPTQCLWAGAMTAGSGGSSSPVSAASSINNASSITVFNWSASSPNAFNWLTIGN